MSELKPLYSVEEALRIQTTKLNQQLNKLLEQNTQIIELTTERDSALAQNAELVAQVEAIKSALELAFISVKTCYKQGWAPYRDVSTAEKALKLTPTQHLRDRDAEKGRAGFVAGATTGARPHPDTEKSHTDYLLSLDADEYAEKVRRGEV